MFSVDWFWVERRLHAAVVAVLCVLLVAFGGGDDPAPPDVAAAVVSLPAGNPLIRAALP